MAPTPEEARKDALAFLKRHSIGVLATAGPRNEAHASMVYYTAGDDFSVYFLTLLNTRKYRTLTDNPRAAFVVATPEIPQTIQIEGLAMDISLDEEAAARKEELFEALNKNAQFYAPITKLDPAMTAVVWLRPTWVRWADYAFGGDGTKQVQVEIPL
jgi:nitroimidazol reductase NimA-like FMN-containing flavoprotein (pyridoxamine 5'-phosphate oxidase superfamily)